MLAIIEILTLACLAAWLACDAVGVFTPSILRESNIIDSEVSENTRRDFWYRTFESWVRPLSELNQRLVTGLLKPIQVQAQDRLTGAEVLATWQIQALLLAMSVGCMMRLFLRWSWSVSIILGLILGGMFLFVRFRLALSTAQRIDRQIRGRLPYTLELMSLLMDAGGTDIMEAFRTAAAESGNHPVGHLFRKLLVKVDQGTALVESLGPWATNYGDSDVMDVAMVMRTALQRGTPLEKTLRSLADQLRIQRLERLEQAAEKCKVHITWPAFLVVGGCLLIAAAPLSLTAHDTLKQTDIFSFF